MRREFCEKDGILITYTDNDVCFEECDTAEAVLISNAGEILHTNFGKERNEYFLQYFKKIYQAVVTLRSLDGMESA